MLAMPPTPLAIAFSEAKSESTNPFNEVSRMNQDKLIEIHADIIQSAILKIASEKPDWFYTEMWLKEILYKTPTNLKPRGSIGPEKADGRNQREDNPFPDF